MAIRKDLVTQIIPPFIEEIELDNYLGSTLKFAQETAPKFLLPSISTIFQLPAIALFVDRFFPDDVRSMQKARYSANVTYAILTADPDHMKSVIKCQELASYFVLWLSSLQYEDNKVSEMLEDDGNMIVNETDGMFDSDIDGIGDEGEEIGLYLTTFNHSFTIRRVQNL